MFNFLSELFNPKDMNKGGQNDPSTRTPRPAPPKRIVPLTRTTPTTNDNSNDLANTIIATEVIIRFILK